MPRSAATKTATTTFSGAMLAVMLGVGLWQAGCAGPPEGAEGAEGAELAPPSGALEVLGEYDADPTSQTGTNGLEPPMFHGKMSAIGSSMTTSLLVNGGLNPNVFGLFGGLLPDESPLPYMLRCGLPIGTSVELYGKAITGMLSTTGAWGKGSVADPRVRGDILACMAVHLNVTGEHVDFMISGKAVRAGEPDPTLPLFTFPEAYWFVDPRAGTTPRFKVWPLPPLKKLCGDVITSQAVTYRVCGDNPVACNLDLEENLEADCVEENGSATCNGFPVIKSWLKADDVRRMYPACFGIIVLPPSPPGGPNPPPPPPPPPPPIPQ